MKFKQNKYFNREISWLSFNHRVLQEAEDAKNPILERLKFLAIYSNNMEEFFRVRVASLRSLETLEKRKRGELFFNPKVVINKIHEIVTHQQFIFGEIFRNEIVSELRKIGVYLTRKEELTDDQRKIVETYFQNEIIQFANPQFFERGKIPEIKDGRLYHAVRLRPFDSDTKEERYAVIAIPSHKVSRFFTFTEGGDFHVLFLGDVMRVGLPFIFPNDEILGCYSINISRDAELHIDDEFEGDLVEKIKEGLEKRKSGMPMRFLYDIRMPQEMLNFFKKVYKLHNLDVVPGGRYHSLSDFFSFPNPNNIIPQYEPIPPVPHPDLEGKEIRKVMAKKDILLQFPYHSFGYIVKWIEEAAKDVSVREIEITLYRVADDSKIVKALIEAAKNRKKITVFVEVKARFNEADNLYWANEMEKVGINVLYSIPLIKVHTKLCCITRIEKGKPKVYAYFGTGNLNEKTAKFYTDCGLLTTDERLTQEAKWIFGSLQQKMHFIEDEDTVPVFNHLLVAPKYMREQFEKRIEFEIKEAKAGRKAKIIAKMNSLDDFRMIDKLYEASNAGVKIELIIRGICCLIPDIKRQSENIKIVSIVGKYLEHTRAYYFWHGGEEQMFLSSGDWMRRNLDRRIEVAFPIYDKKLKADMLSALKMQLSDNQNARIIDRYQSNPFVRPKKGDELVDTHQDMYKLLDRDK